MTRLLLFYRDAPPEFQATVSLLPSVAWTFLCPPEVWSLWALAVLSLVTGTAGIVLRYRPVLAVEVVRGPR